MRKQSVFGFMLAVLWLVFAVSCVPTAGVVRDLPNSGYELFATYDSGGSASEKVGVTIHDAGAMPLGRVTYVKRGGAQLESMEVYSPTLGTFVPFSEMTQYTTGEDLLKIRKATYVTQHLIGTGLVSPKSELRFQQNILNAAANQDFALTCVYLSGVDEKKKYAEGEQGAEIVNRAKSWFGKVEQRSMTGKKWSPYVAAIEGSEACTKPPADWARQKIYFDENVIRARQLVRILEASGWQGLPSGQGRVYRVIGTPTSFNDLANFENSFYGWALGSDGKKYEYRVRPIYKIVNTTKPSFGWAKQNSRNPALQALVLELEVAGGVYQQQAVVYFVKGWFQRNSLYGVKRLGPGQAAESYVNRIFDQIDIRVPPEVETAMKNDDLAKVVAWEDSLPRFDMTLVDSEFVTIIDLQDVTEDIPCVSSEGSCSAKGPRGIAGNYHLRGDPMALSYFETLLGDRAAENLDLHYIQPDGGDGWGHVARVSMVIRHYLEKRMTYWDAVALDLRSVDSPDEVARAVDFFFRR